MKAFDYYKQMSDYYMFDKQDLPNVMEYFKNIQLIEDINTDELDEMLEKLNWFAEQHEIIFLENANDWIESAQDKEEMNRVTNSMIGSYEAVKSLREQIERLKDLLS